MGQLTLGYRIDEDDSVVGLVSFTCELVFVRKVRSLSARAALSLGLCKDFHIVALDFFHRSTVPTSCVQDFRKSLLLFPQQAVRSRNHLRIPGVVPIG